MPVAARNAEVHRHDERSGRWVSIVGDDGGLRIDVGSTGNALDPARRVRLARHHLRVDDAGASLRSTWPVPEVMTHRIGQWFDDLAGELSGDSHDPDAVRADLDDLLLSVLGHDRHAPGTRSTPRTVGWVLSVAYPLLSVPIAQGASPATVPLAAEHVLRARDVRTAARAALGPRVTRPLVRALARSLLPHDDGRIHWEPLLVALMAAPRCGPEQLARILTTPVHRPGAVRFSVADIERARAMLLKVPPRRAAEELCAALAEADGTTRLARRIIEWDSRPDPPAPRRPAVPRRRAVAPGARGLEPTQIAPDPCNRPIDYPGRWRAAADETVLARRVVYPRCGNELLDWGERMGNCLGAYRMPAATGQTRIIGFERGGSLDFVVEVSAGGVLRQLEGRGNTIPDRATQAVIVDWLRARRLMTTDGRRNR